VFTSTSTDSALALYLERGETWALYESNQPGLGPFLCSRSTADILTRGTLERDAMLAYQGSLYRVTALYEAGCLVARAVST